ncbi:hypothetical protein [Amycolatopsis sp. RTGN1]|uniref:hypothetical protein n=1 Tax=Amycolatopsis ponsaeliensis TaxID=2992142 RepID=UPI00254FB90E|nr:hypothetical protein [Amycolatopsis sp. RTGN1]
MVHGRSRPLLRVVDSPADVPEPRPATLGSRDRYADLDDRRLAAILAAEDTAEEHGLNPHTRSTCYVHRCWAHQCVGSPLHVLVVTGHRWCRRCECPVDVAVDETPPGAVHLYCPRCGQAGSAANREVRQACRTSLSAMHGGDTPTLYGLPDA